MRKSTGFRAGTWSVCVTLVMLLTPACSKKKSSDSDKQGKGMAAPSTMRPTPMTMKGPGGDAMRPVARPTMRPTMRPATRATPGPAKAKCLTKADLEPTGKKPSYGAMQKTAVKYGLKRAVLVGPRVALGGRRFAYAVRDDTNYYILEILGHEKGWKVVRRIPFLNEHYRDAEANSPCVKQKHVVMSIYVKDYDCDGKPELKIRYRYCTDHCGLGKWTTTHLMILNLGAKAGVALRTTIGFEREKETLVGNAYFKDKNGDGFPDLLLHLRYKPTPAAGTAGKKRTERRRFAYVPAKDRFEPQADAKKGTDPTLEVPAYADNLIVGGRHCPPADPLYKQAKASTVFSILTDDGWYPVVTPLTTEITCSQLKIKLRRLRSITGKHFQSEATGCGGMEMGSFENCWGLAYVSTNRTKQMCKKSVSLTIKYKRDGKVRTQQCSANAYEETCSKSCLANAPKPCYFGYRRP